MSYNKLQDLDGNLTKIAGSAVLPTVATTSKNGLMSKEDKAKLDKLTTITVQGVISAGQSSVTLSHSSIKENSFISIYFKDKIMSAKSVTVESGSITVEIHPQDTDTVVGVRCL